MKQVTIEDDPPIIIYCDGGVRGNGKERNLGAWGVILQYLDNEKALSGISVNTTNNQMELIACIKALQALKRKDIRVEVISDSAYLVNGMTSWIYAWINNGWENSSGKKVKNIELWKELYNLCQEFRFVGFYHVKGHAECEGNRRVDALLNKCMDEWTALYGV